MEDERMDVFDNDRRFNASMVCLSIVIAIIIILSAVGAWDLARWVCGLVRGCL